MNGDHIPKMGVYTLYLYPIWAFDRRPSYPGLDAYEISV